MVKKPKKPNPFTGRWHILWMAEWEEDYINEEVRAFIEFDAVDSRKRIREAMSPFNRGSASRPPRERPP